MSSTFIFTLRENTARLQEYAPPKLSLQALLLQCTRWACGCCSLERSAGARGPSPLPAGSCGWWVSLLMPLHLASRGQSVKKVGDDPLALNSLLPKIWLLTSPLILFFFFFPLLLTVLGEVGLMIVQV